MPAATIDGVTYPSVTEILAAVGVGWSRICGACPYAPAWATSVGRAADIGTAVHKAIALEFAGVLDDASLHPEVRPGVEAFRAFRDAVKLVPRAVEMRLLSRAWGVVGHPDFVGHLNGDGQLVLIDWKFTDSVDVTVAGLQVAAYQLLWNESQADRVGRCFVGQLRKNGTYNLIDVTNPTRAETFKAAVIVWRALKAMGRLDAA